MNKLLFLLLLTIPLLSQTCQPLYWQIDPNYSASLDQTATVASQTIILKDVSTSHGIGLYKKEFIVFDVKGKGTYDDTNVKAKISNDAIEVTGGVINLKFQCYLMTKPATGHGYDGSVTASLNNITVNYTKKPALVKGAAIWTLANLSPSIPNNLISDNNYNPTPFNVTDKEYFGNLIHTDLYSQLSAYYNMNLSTLYAQALQTQAMSKTFNSSTTYVYQYPGSNSSININVSVSKFSISEKNGVALGYVGQVQGNQERCSDFTPDLTEKASFITKDFILGVWEGFSKTQAWQPSTLDSSLLRSKYFKFKIVDLDSIAPTITSKFTNLLEPLVAKCYLKTFSPTLNFDQENQRIGTNLDWTCSLVRTFGNNEQLLKFDASLSYKAVVDQVGNKLSVRIAQAAILSSNWIPTVYPIVNVDLANIYLKDLVQSLSNVNTVGDGFLQPSRKSPVVTISDRYIKISEDATILKQE